MYRDPRSLEDALALRLEQCGLSWNRLGDCKPTRLLSIRSLSGFPEGESALRGVLAVDSVRAHLPRPVLANFADRQIAFGVGALAGERVVGAVSFTPAHEESFGLVGLHITLNEGSYTVDLAFVCTGEPAGRYLVVSAGGRLYVIAEW